MLVVFRGCLSFCVILGCSWG